LLLSDSAADRAAMATTLLITEPLDDVEVLSKERRRFVIGAELGANPFEERTKSSRIFSIFSGDEASRWRMMSIGVFAVISNSLLSLGFNSAE
jgi:hypothetical protein